MTEVGGELNQSPEFATKNENTALQVRLLKGGNYLIPSNRALDKVTEEIGKPNEIASTVNLMNHASTHERIDYWKDKTGNHLDAWLQSTTTFLHKAENKNHVDVFSKLIIGEDTNKINLSDTTTQEDAKKLYQRYFADANQTLITFKSVTGEVKTIPSNIHLFVQDILGSYTNQGIVDLGRLSADMASIQQLASMFGEKSNNLIKELLLAQAKTTIDTERKKLVDQVNEEKSENNATVLRINYLNPYEEESLKWLTGDHGTVAISTSEPVAKTVSQTQPTQIENGEVLPPELHEMAVQGRGFEAIAKFGWEQYRDCLTKISYADILTQQNTQIQKLETEPKAPRLTPEQLREQNKDIWSRTQKLMTKLMIDYPIQSSDPFFAFDDTKGTKFTVRGREYSVMTQTDQSLDRFYIGVNQKNVPEAYMSLFKTLQEEDVLRYIDFTLFRENLQSENNPMVVDNSIIIYTPPDNPLIMEKIARAIMKAKKGDPSIWDIPSNHLAELKSSSLCYYKIPMDSATGFVEMDSTSSYDATHRITIEKEIFQTPNGGRDPRTENVQEVLKKMKPWTPSNQGIFTSPALRNRRKYMPALVFSEVKKPLNGEQKETKLGETIEDGALIKQLFPDFNPEEIKNTLEIRNIVSKSDAIKNQLPVYYPGSGFDIRFPLAYSDSTNLVFVDFVYVHSDGSVKTDYLPDQEIEKIGGNIKSVSTEGIFGLGGRRIVIFDWNGKERKLVEYAEDATKFKPVELEHGSSMTIIKAPTPFSRIGANIDEVPDYIFNELPQILSNTVIGGFVQFKPTQVLQPSVIGFEKVVDNPIPPNSRTNWPNTASLHKKTMQTADIEKLVKLDANFEIALAMRDGRYTQDAGDDTLGYFKDSLQKLHDFYVSLPQNTRDALMPDLKQNLIPTQISDRVKSLISKFGKKGGITDEAKVLEYFEKSKIIASEIFPEIVSQTQQVP